MSNTTFNQLKNKQRKIRSGFSEPVGLRIHRAISWFGRAEREVGDDDVRFVILWVGFNAAYAQDVGSDPSGERDAFKTYFQTLVRCDSENRIYDAVWSRFSSEIRLLLCNKYVFAPFWSHHNGQSGFEDWEKSLAASQKVVSTAMAQQDTVRILTILFDRLYVLRNQIVHGGATWNGSVNRDQVRNGAAILDNLLPIFIDVMMDSADENWGKPFYPVIA